MTSVFDGMAGVLSGVFGAPVTVFPQSSPASTVQGLFRIEPIEVNDEGTFVMMMVPTLKVRRDLLAALERGDLVRPSTSAGAGKTYRVLNQLASASPAADAFNIYQLELVEE